MDIEGTEHRILAELDLDNACNYIKQIVLEIHRPLKKLPAYLHKLERCFSLFHRDQRFFIDSYRGEYPTGHLTEWQVSRVLERGFDINLNLFRDEKQLAMVLFHSGELYFVNEHFLNN